MIGQPELCRQTQNKSTTITRQVTRGDLPVSRRRNACTKAVYIYKQINSDYFYVMGNAQESTRKCVLLDTNDRGR